jgi:hypothetical protein
MYIAQLQLASDKYDGIKGRFCVAVIFQLLFVQHAENCVCV